MDCRGFRKQHFAYLDDTLPGDEMSAAQRHIMGCDSCAAHDTMVRRSLMLVRNMSVIEPSVEFRQRMAARLTEARAEGKRNQFLLQEQQDNPKSRLAVRPPMLMIAVAATIVVAGTVVWQRERAPTVATLVSMQSVPSAQPAVVTDTTQEVIHIAPGMVQAMATGNPMWPAALMIDDASSHFATAGFTEVKEAR